MRPRGTKLFMAVMVVSLILGCSTATTPGGATPSSGADPSADARSSSAAGPATPSAATGGPTSSTVPATAAPADSTPVELAGPPPHFVPADLETGAGDVSFFLKNTSQGFHTMSIGPALREPIVTSTTIEPGKSAIFSVQGLQPGPYIVWCTISDHVALGMVGTLDVK